MPKDKLDRIETHFRLAPAVKALLRERAKVHQMGQSEYVAYLVRQEAQQSRLEAMFSERNEYDR